MVFLSEELGDGLGFDQFAGLVEVVVDDGFRIDPAGVVHGGQQFGGMDRIFGGAAPGLVGLAVDIAAFGAGARYDGGVAVGPVVASVGAVAVAGGAHALDGGAAKFADGHHEGILKEAAGIHVFDEGGEPLVEHWAGFGFHPIGESGVMVPRMVVGVGDLGPDDFDDAGAGLHEATGEQAALAEGVAAVTIAHGIGFLGDVEGVAGFA